MDTKFKDFLYGLGGIGFMILIFGGFVLLIVGGVKLFEIIYPVLQKIDTFVWGIVWLLILLSLAPRLRNFTGNGIVLGTYIGGAIFWLVCFYITYSLWGFLGILIGVGMFGLGVFFTALLALIFSGQFMGALGVAFVLLQIYLFRFLGAWIITKYKPVNDYRTVVESDHEIGSETSDTYKFCSQCGKKINDASSFCDYCGTKQ